MSYDTLNFFFCKSNNLDGAFGVDPEGVKFRRKLKGSNILSASFDSCANPTQRHLDGGFAGPVDRGQGQSLCPRSTDLRSSGHVKVCRLCPLRNIYIRTYVIWYKNSLQLLIFFHFLFIIDMTVGPADGAWPSGKATGFDPVIRRFESFRPSRTSKTVYLSISSCETFESKMLNSDLKSDMLAIASS